MLSNFIKKVTSGGITSVVGAVGKVVDNIHTSEEEKLKIKAEIAKIEKEHLLKMKEVQNEADKLVMEEVKAKTALMIAETNSDDKFVRRVRPIIFLSLTFVFLLLLFMFGIASLLGIALTITPEFMAMMEMFKSIYMAFLSIYVGGRTVEKVTDKYRKREAIRYDKEDFISKD